MRGDEADLLRTSRQPQRDRVAPLLLPQAAVMLLLALLAFFRRKTNEQDKTGHSYISYYDSERNPGCGACPPKSANGSAPSTLTVW